MTTWYKWSDIHEDPDQQKRIESAKKAACTPVSLDKDNKTGEFSGSHGKYVCSLEKCNCVDFARRKLPCKHMYRLAIELGVHEAKGVIEANKDKIKIPRKDAVAAFEAAVKLIDTYPDDVQKYIKYILYLNKKDLDDYVHADEIKELSQPINDGLLVIEKADAEIAFKHHCRTKAKTFEALEQKGFTFPPEVKDTPNAKYAYCKEHKQAICDIICPDYCSITSAGVLKDSLYRTYNYLLHKYNEEQDDVAIRLIFHFE